MVKTGQQIGHKRRAPSPSTSIDHLNATTINLRPNSQELFSTRTPQKSESNKVCQSSTSGQESARTKNTSLPQTWRPSVWPVWYQARNMFLKVLGLHLKSLSLSIMFGQFVKFVYPCRIISAHRAKLCIVRALAYFTKGQETSLAHFHEFVQERHNLVNLTSFQRNR